MGEKGRGLMFPLPFLLHLMSMCLVAISLCSAINLIHWTCCDLKVYCLCSAIWINAAYGDFCSSLLDILRISYDLKIIILQFCNSTIDFQLDMNLVITQSHFTACVALRFYLYSCFGNAHIIINNMEYC